MSGESAEVVRWYTRARRFPQLIGRTPDGTRILGGPYTLTQGIGAGVVLVMAVLTQDMWARFGLVWNAGLLAGALAATVFGLRMVPAGARNPVSLLAGLLRSLTAPRAGRINGKPVRISKPHRLRHTIVVATPASHPEAPPTPAAGESEPMVEHNQTATPNDVASVSSWPPEPGARPPALTGVQSLLASVGGRRNEPEERELT